MDVAQWNLSDILQALCLIPRTETKMECLRLVLVTYSSLKRGEGWEEEKKGEMRKERERETEMFTYIR